MAELAGREAAWAAALRDFDVKDSVFLTQVAEEERAKGKLVGKIQTYQEVLKLPPTPDAELFAKTDKELALILAELRQRPHAN
jgi:hypothetical protein